MLLRKRAEDILDMVDKTTDEFRSMDDITGGDIHVGGAETDAIKYLAKAARDLQERYPNIRYHIYSGNASDVMERNDIESISPRPMLFIAGESAHSIEFSEGAYRRAAEPKELVIVPGAGHVDLYDRVNLIPFAKLTDFFMTNLK
jgi:Hydrolases of the alpha/beta superfamily